ncbi:MAG: hypothetical protein K5888_11330 [Lachnospiraceae bacterium]|nr:hypothetical protein [Lachnospiraceae bacterium]
MIIFTICLLCTIVFRLMGFAIRLGWGAIRIAFFLVFLPAAILVLIFGGLVSVALPVLIIIGIIGLISRARA